MEEIEEIQAQQREEEIEVLAKQVIVESENAMAFERQRVQVESVQILEKQRQARIQVQRAQRRNALALEKAQIAASRNREKVN